MPSRADTFRKFIERSPGDPFPRYSLAMELRKSGSEAEAHAEFAELERLFPDYVPQYLMHANLLVAIHRTDEAREVLRRGIAVAGRRGEGHALGEMQAALDALG